MELNNFYTTFLLAYAVSVSIILTTLLTASTYQVKTSINKLAFVFIVNGLAAGVIALMSLLIGCVIFLLSPASAMP